MAILTWQKWKKGFVIENHDHWGQVGGGYSFKVIFLIFWKVTFVKSSSLNISISHFLSSVQIWISLLSNEHLGLIHKVEIKIWIDPQTYNRWTPSAVHRLYKSPHVMFQLQFASVCRNIEKGPVCVHNGIESEMSSQWQPKVQILFSLYRTISL